MIDLRTLISDPSFYKISNNESPGYFLSIKDVLTSLSTLFQSMNVYGEHDFIVYGEDRFSFKKTFELSSKLAFSLQQELGIKKGDKVSLVISNRPEFVISYIAVVLCGGVIVPIGHLSTLDTCEYIVKHSESSIVICESKKITKHLIKSLDLNVVSLPTVLSNKSRTFASLLENSGEVEVVNGENNDVASIMYTSGSTGRPRGVICTNENILSSILSWAMFGCPYESDSINYSKPLDHACLIAAPLSHTTSCLSLFLLSVLIGRKIVLMSHWDANRAINIIQEESVNYFNGVPTMSSDLAGALKSSGELLPSLSHISSAGSKRSNKYLVKIRNALPDTTIMSGYGTTETNAMGSIAFGDDYLQFPDSAGFPVPPLVQISVFDSNMNQSNPGEIGEVAIKSPSNSPGYYNDMESTKASFVNGWHLTGDLGYKDEDGRLFIKGRKKELIISGGQNISIFEVESILNEIEGVKQSIVFPISDDRLGETVGALVHVNEKLGITSKELETKCTERLDWYKVPKHISISPDPLPALSSGKVDKQTVINQYSSIK